MEKSCSVESCNNKHDSKGFCKTHYLRWKRHGNPLKLADPNETRKKLSNARKGKTASIETRKKMSESMKKRIPNPKSLEALRIANKKRIGSKRPEITEKLSSALKKKWADPIYRKRMTVIRKNQFSNPNTISKISKSLTSLWSDPKYRKRQSESHKGITSGMLGKKHSLETRRKLSTSHKGQIPWSAGKKYSETKKKQMSEIRKKWIKQHPEVRIEQSIRVQKWLKEHPEFIKQASERRAKQKFPFKDTSLEKSIQNILHENGIQFKKHHNIKLEHSNHQADILVEPNLIIEGFGDYWHFNPKKYDGNSLQRRRQKLVKVKSVWEYDQNIIDGMKKHGYDVLILWESELKNEFEKTVDKILKFVNQK